VNIKSPHIPTLKVKIIGEIKKALAFIKHSGFQALLTLLGLCQLVMASSGGNS
jgi:hypothetical protein